MIGYHWSPVQYRGSIRKHGLLVPIRHPRLTVPTTCSAGHRNPHISLGRNPHDAWRLSGGFLADDPEPGNAPVQWDLWQVDLGRQYRAYGMELQSMRDIPRRRLRWVAERAIQ